MATDRPPSGWWVVPAAAVLLLWPALWNGYPIVFADTGTYLSQAIHRYAGWDRPVFYSVFMLPLHATVSVWPVVVVQAWLTVWVMWVVCRVLLANFSAATFAGGVAVLAAGTWLPWIVSELMPDLFTPLLILVLCLLGLVPERLARWEQFVFVGLAAFMIASQLSSLPLAVALLAVIVVARHLGKRPGAVDGLAVSARRHGRHMGSLRRSLLIIAPPGLAVVSLCMVNLSAHGQFAVSPFGNVFLLARVIYDGPGMTVLRRDCPVTNWRLCPFLNAFPATSDDFLWMPESPLNRAGGPKMVSADAGAIIGAALVADPGGILRATVGNTMAQLVAFASGDGLTPWPEHVSPWIERNFPPGEIASYALARQQRGDLAVPPALLRLHQGVAWSGVIAGALLLPIALRRRAACGGFLLIVLLALPVSAAITGGLSTPHDRYQSRIMWLPCFISAVSVMSLRGIWRRRFFNAHRQYSDFSVDDG